MALCPYLWDEEQDQLSVNIRGLVVPGTETSISSTHRITQFPCLALPIIDFFGLMFSILSNPRDIVWK
jgi:hypothetical protein